MWALRCTAGGPRQTHARPYCPTTAHLCGAAVCPRQPVVVHRQPRLPRPLRQQRRLLLLELLVVQLLIGLAQPLLLLRLLLALLL